jgi:hypothetical protein
MWYYSNIKDMHSQKAPETPLLGEKNISGLILSTPKIAKI